MPAAAVASVFAKAVLMFADVTHVVWRVQARRGRGALRLAVGPRVSARLHDAGHAENALRRPAVHGPDGDGNEPGEKYVGRTGPPPPVSVVGAHARMRASVCVGPAAVDVQMQLRLVRPLLLESNFNRPNLRYACNPLAQSANACVSPMRPFPSVCPCHKPATKCCPSRATAWPRSPSSSRPSTTASAASSTASRKWTASAVRPTSL